MDNNTFPILSFNSLPQNDYNQMNNLQEPNETKFVLFSEISQLPNTSAHNCKSLKEKEIQQEDKPQPLISASLLHKKEFSLIKKNLNPQVKRSISDQILDFQPSSGFSFLEVNKVYNLLLDFSKRYSNQLEFIERMARKHRSNETVENQANENKINDLSSYILSPSIQQILRETLRTDWLNIREHTDWIFNHRENENRKAVKELTISNSSSTLKETQPDSGSREAVLLRKFSKPKIIQRSFSAKMIQSAASLLLKFSEIKTVLEKLNLFIIDYQNQLQSLEDILVDNKNQNNLNWKESNENIPLHIRQKLRESLEGQWLIIQQEIDRIFDCKETQERKITFRNLGLDEPNPIPMTTLEKFKSIFRTNTNLDEEKPLEIARKFLQKLFLNLGIERSLTNKSNIQKMQQFNQRQVKIEGMLFGYIQDLFLLGELLQSFPEKIQKSDQAILSMMHHFACEIKEIKGIKNLEFDQQKKAIDSYCEQLGRCIKIYGKTLAIYLRKHLLSIDNNIYHPFLMPQLNQNPLDFINFKPSMLNNFVDFRRAVEGQYLFVSSDKYILDSPPLLEGNHKNFSSLLSPLVKFLIQNLEIDIHLKQEYLNPAYVLETLNNGKENVYKYLEEAWAKKKEQEGIKAKMTGFFKLLPIFRLFHQSILLGISSSMIMIESSMSTNVQAKIIQEIPTGGISSTKDQDTKQINLSFKDDTLIVTIERLGVLGKHNTNKNMKDPFTNCFMSCMIKTRVVLTTSLSNLDHWTSTSSVLIERPSVENDNLTFLDRYATLISILETIGIEYKVQEI